MTSSSPRMLPFPPHSPFLVRLAPFLALLALLLASCAGPAIAEDAGGDAMDGLDSERFAIGYPAVIAQLDSGDPDAAVTALRTIAATGDVDAIPLLVELLFSDRAGKSPAIHSWAAAALRDVVSTHELRRRDPDRGDAVVLLPRSPEHVDLRATLKPVVDTMLNVPDDDPAMLGGGATIAGYLGLVEFRGRIASLVESKHPAVRNSAANALELLQQAQVRSSTRADSKLRLGHSESS